MNFHLDCIADTICHQILEYDINTLAPSTWISLGAHSA